MWLYNNKEINNIESMPENPYGFIYQITHKPSGKKYIGKKALYSERNVKLGKKELKALKEQRKAEGVSGRTPTKKKVIKESNWKSYYGSQKEIKSLVKEGEKEDFKREILQFVSSKKLLTYYECKYLFINNAIEDSNFINDNILGKFFTKDFYD